MYSYDLFQEIRGPRINLTRLNKTDIEEAVTNLFSLTTWPVAKRGLKTKGEVKTYLTGFLEKDLNNESLSLIARISETGEVAGFSRFHSAGPNFLRVEIGYSWIADRWQRTFVNTEKKLLMLNYAFEEIKVKRVEFAVDPLNEKSNKAMTRVGATFEGTLRKWRFLSDTDKGDRNIYSVIDDEWPQVKTRLEAFLKI